VLASESEVGPDAIAEAVRDRAVRAGVGLSDEQCRQLSAYFELLRRWNRKINLTALPLEFPDDQALDRLLIEPIAAATHVGSESIRWVDLGSGGGSPAIPMKIMRPEAELTMVEARSRKVAFLREAARELTLRTVAAVSERIEALPARDGFLAAVDLITLRAVRLNSELFQVCRLLLRAQGRLMLFQTSGKRPAKLSEFELERAVKPLSWSDFELAIYRPI
jgi:16S rRNA (guanine527-N7)-methyltransferase